MAEYVSLSVTDASNTARFPEGQAANTVNDGARALEGMTARNVRDTQGYITSGGSTNAYTIALNAKTTAAAAGEKIRFKANFTNTGATTVNITPSGGSARGAVAVQRGGKALVGGEIISGCFYDLDYDGTQYQISGAVQGLQLWDTNQSHKTQVVNGTNISADRTLTIAAGDADRTVTISGDATISQDYSSATGVPQFLRLGVGLANANAAIKTAHPTSAENLVWFQHTHATTPAGMLVQFTAASPDNNTIYFASFADSTTQRCIIYSDGDLQNHDNSYGAISDERLKQDITVAPSQWDDVKALAALAKKYRFKTDAEKNPAAPLHLGLVAQEVLNVSPGLVQVGSDGMYSVQYSIAYMKALKALGEAMERIESLEARVTALGG
jgi:hypothetical protein